jgi:hypothetical protein
MGNGALAIGPQATAPILDSTNRYRIGASQRTVVKGHVWTAPAVQEESDVSAKRSGAAMYPACFAWRIASITMQPDVAAGPDVIR